MELRVLEYFLTVAREGSFNSAAERLNLSQPTLSRQIRDMETALGKSLLIRGNNGITLTEEGMLLRKRAQEILNLVEKTESEVTAAGEDLSGDIYIGAGETESVHFIAEAAQRIHKRYPNTRFHISSGDTQDLCEELDKGLIDLALVFDDVDQSKYHFLELPEKARWGVLVRKDDPFSSRSTVSRSDLWDVPLILSRQIHQNSTALVDWIGRPLSELNIVATYNLLYNASVLAAAGLGCVLCIDRIINTSGDSNLVFVPLEPALMGEMKIVWKKYQVFSRLSELFLEEIRYGLSEIEP